MSIETKKKILAFVVCTEPGQLEFKAMLLIKSIRHFGGRLRNAPIYSFQPRGGGALTAATLGAFSRFGVTHNTDALNTAFPEYPFANKIAAAAYAEQHVETRFLAFVDSDKVFFKEPAALILPEGFSAGVRPVHTKNIGTDGRNDSNRFYWEKLYNELDCSPRHHVQATVTEETILPYWNAGLITVRRRAGIFSVWEKNFQRIMRLGLQPQSGSFFVEQSVLSATICALGVHPLTLPSSYNYPFSLHNHMPPSKRIGSLENVVSVHYHDMFDMQRSAHPLERLREIDLKTEKALWFRNQLRACRVYFGS